VRILILCIRVFDSISTCIITFLFRIQQLLTGVLPAVASPDELTRYLQALTSLDPVFNNDYQKSITIPFLHSYEHAFFFAISSWSESRVL
jgi:hypothetical protein